MDVRMPGLDGCQATRLLRAEEDSRSTVVIAISAGAFEHEREPLLEAGCDDYVTKPFRPARVYELMERHLGVRFRYQKTSGTEAQAVAEGPISVDRLANIDAVVLQELLEALDAGDAAAALAVLEGCPEREAAEQLAQMIRGYRFDDVAEVLQKALGVAR
jgi:two-component system sensor histidine kinase/response regulator